MTPCNRCKELEEKLDDYWNKYMIAGSQLLSFNRLQAENLQMREALENALDLWGAAEKRRMENPKHTGYILNEAMAIFGQHRDILKLPHTAKLAARIQALEEVISELRKIKDTIGSRYLNSTYEALSKLDALEKE